MKKYMDIERLKPETMCGFEAGDEIVIQEKIDGANFSIKYDENSNSVKAFSRRRELNFKNNLRGAFEWSQALDVQKVKDVLGNNLILFGEWLVKHTVPYPDEKYDKPYFFDVYNSETESYLGYSDTQEMISKLNLVSVPTLMETKFTNWEDLENLIGTTRLGGEYGEGIVVKNQTKLNNPNTRTPFYVKLVGDKFCETKAHKGLKHTNIEVLKERQALQDIVSTVVTRARVEKMLNILVDDGTIPESWNQISLKIISRHLGRMIYYDCVKEEKEVVESVGESFGKIASSMSMRIAREIAEEKSKVF